jgi:hypothetical protein
VPIEFNRFKSTVLWKTRTFDCEKLGNIPSLTSIKLPEIGMIFGFQVFADVRHCCRGTSSMPSFSVEAGLKATRRSAFHPLRTVVQPDVKAPQLNCTLPAREAEDGTSDRLHGVGSLFQASGEAGA